MSSLVKQQYRSFKNKQDGTATIEFVLLFPAFIFLFLTGFEAGYYMVRNVMLERAVDIAVRDVRLGNGRVPEYTRMKQMICDEALILHDCVDSIQIEMSPVSLTPGSTNSLRGPAKCIDKLSSDDPLTGTLYDVGEPNDMMIVRVCSLSKPLFPTTGIGVGMQIDADGNYAIVATTGFVNEPGNRGTSTVVVSVPMGGHNRNNNGFGNGDQNAPGNSLNYNAAENDQTVDSLSISGGTQ